MEESFSRFNESKIFTLLMVCKWKTNQPRKIILSRIMKSYIYKIKLNLNIIIYIYIYILFFFEENLNCTDI